MQEARLSNYELEEYLEFILPMDLIVYSETTQRYRLTDKGLNYLQTYYKTKNSVGAYTSPREKNRAYT